VISPRQSAQSSANLRQAITDGLATDVVPRLHLDTWLETVVLTQARQQLLRCSFELASLL
jgi:hypothetical protein